MPDVDVTSFGWKSREGSILAEIKQEGSFTLLVECGPSSDWMRPLISGYTICCTQPTDSDATLSETSSQAASRTMLYPVSGHRQVNTQTASERMEPVSTPDPSLPAITGRHCPSLLAVTGRHHWPSLSVITGRHWPSLLAVTGPH